MAMLGALQLVLLSCMLFAFLGAGSCSLVGRIVFKRLERLAPAARARALLGFAAAPAFLALVLTVACLLPWFLSPMLPSLDHCQEHGGHAHLCFTHRPSAPGHLAGWLILLTAAAYFTAAAARGTAALVRARALLRRLRASLEPGPIGGVFQIQTSSPVCFAAGLLRPTVVISTALVARLRREQVAAILAHERAHVSRRDALSLMIARALVIFQLPAMGRRIVAELELASELACDEAAADAVGDRFIVANAIVAVRKLIEHLEPSPDLGVANFGVSALDTRICALVNEPLPAPSRRSPVLAVAAVLLVSALAGAETVHHTTETVLSVLNR